MSESTVVRMQHPLAAPRARIFATLVALLSGLLACGCGCGGSSSSSSSSEVGRTTSPAPTEAHRRCMADAERDAALQSWIRRYDEHGEAHVITHLPPQGAFCGVAAVLGGAAGNDTCYTPYLLVENGGWREVRSFDPGCDRSGSSEHALESIGFAASNGETRLVLEYVRSRRGDDGNSNIDEGVLEVFTWGDAGLERTRLFVTARRVSEERMDMECYEAVMDEGLGDYTATSECALPQEVRESWSTHVDTDTDTDGGAFTTTAERGSPPADALGRFPLDAP